MTAVLSTQVITHDTAPDQAEYWATKLASGHGPTFMHVDIALRYLRRREDFGEDRLFHANTLAREVWGQMQRLVSHVWFGNGPAVQDGMLYADARAAEFLDGFGETGADFAATLRRKARERWDAAKAEGKGPDAPELWKAWIGLDGKAWTLPIANVLALCAWCETIAARLENYLCPAISMAVLDEAVRTLWQRPSNTLAMHRVFRWAVARAFDQKVCSRLEASVTLEGGYLALGRETGSHSSAGGKPVREALEALRAAVELQGQGKEPWLSHYSTAAAPNRPAVLKLTVGAMMKPCFVSGMPNRTTRQRYARKLVPVPELLPPLVGRANEQSAQCTLQMLLLGEFRTHAVDLVRNGHINVSATRWLELANMAGVSARVLPAVVAAWTSSGIGDTFLKGHGVSGISLGRSYSVFTEFLARSAQLQRNGYVASKAAYMRHQARLARRCTQLKAVAFRG